MPLFVMPGAPAVTAFELGQIAIWFARKMTMRVTQRIEPNLGNPNPGEFSIKTPKQTE
ncbi:MAG: hypothetical protein WCG63_03090 [Opitutaceae bacterium]